MAPIENTSHGDYRKLSIPWLGRPASTIIICLAENDALFSTLQKSAGDIQIIRYDGVALIHHNIVATYNHALDTLSADFFLFCHQDVQGDLVAFLQNALPATGRLDIVGAIGKTLEGTTLWRNTLAPTDVATLDECCFGFFAKSRYRFDTKLKWTNYSQDLCCRARANGHRAIVVPNSIGHARHKWGPWFVEQGFYQREHAYLTNKWGPTPRS